MNQQKLPLDYYHFFLSNGSPEIALIFIHSFHFITLFFFFLFFAIKRSRQSQPSIHSGRRRRVQLAMTGWMEVSRVTGQVMQRWHVVQFPIILWAVCFLTLRWGVTLATGQQCGAKDRNIQSVRVCVCFCWYLCLHVSRTENQHKGKGGERQHLYTHSLEHKPHNV